MTDFLHNLATRNLDPTAAIQPRLPSRFEPTDVASAQVFSQQINSDRPDLGAASHHIEFGALTPAHPPTPARESPATAVWRPLAKMPQQPPADLTTSGPYRGRLLGQRPESAKPVIIQQTRVVSEPPPMRPAPDSTSPASHPTLVPVLGAEVAGPSVKSEPKQPKPERPTSPLATARHEADATSSRRAVVGERRLTPGPVLERTVIERVALRDEGQPTTSHPEPVLIRETSPSRQASVVARPQVTPYIEPATPVLAGPTAKSDPTPAIQVTIGRIEVRATPPPAPATRKERPKPPVMSLDEYLRQRAGGDRR